MSNPGRHKRLCHRANTTAVEDHLATAFRGCQYPHCRHLAKRASRRAAADTARETSATLGALTGQCQEGCRSEWTTNGEETTRIHAPACTWLSGPLPTA